MSKRRGKKFGVLKWIGIFKNGLKFYHLSDLMKISGLEYAAARKAAQKLVRGKILIKIGPEYFANNFSTVQTEEIANAAYSPSYVSCETVLFQQGVLDQAPFAIVSISTRKSRRIRITGNYLYYRKVKPSLFWGYQRMEGCVKAEPEKAFLDWLYFQSKTQIQSGLDEINWDMLDMDKLWRYARKYPEHIRKALRTIRK